MPITITVNTAERVRYSVFSGTINDKDLLDAYARSLQAPDFDPTLNGLVDARAVRRVDVTPAGLRHLADLIQTVDRLQLPTKVAIVAESDVAFGMARMYQSIRADGGAPSEHRVFREMSEAREWLGLGPENGA
jgi:hypothetical protein